MRSETKNMKPSTFEAAFLAQTVWSLARSSNTDELTAIACTLRNHVVPRMGQVAAFKTFTEACENFLAVYPLRERPTLQEPAFISYPDGLLAVIEAIYSCSFPDTTSTQAFPNGAKYFARVSELKDDDWRKVEVVNRPGVHPLIGTIGSQQFFV